MPVFSRLSFQMPRQAARQNRQRYQHEDFGGSVLKPSKLFASYGSEPEEQVSSRSRACHVG